MGVCFRLLAHPEWMYQHKRDVDQTEALVFLACCSKSEKNDLGSTYPLVGIQNVTREARAANPNARHVYTPVLPPGLREKGKREGNMEAIPCLAGLFAATTLTCLTLQNACHGCQNWIINWISAPQWQSMEDKSSLEAPSQCKRMPAFKHYRAMSTGEGSRAVYLEKQPAFLLQIKWFNMSILGTYFERAMWALRSCTLKNPFLKCEKDQFQTSGPLNDQGLTWQKHSSTVLKRNQEPVLKFYLFIY